MLPDALPTGPAAVPPRVARQAMIARWKPVHLGHAAVLEALVASADETLVGIGSSNRWSARNPFTADETADMIRCVLGDRAGYRIVPVPDLDDGPRWRAMVVELFGPLDRFVTANGYVKHLLERDYPMIHPAALVPPERRVAVCGTRVRLSMARGEPWRHLVPPAVADLLEQRGLVERFRSQLGAETIAIAAAEGGYD